MHQRPTDASLLAVMKSTLHTQTLDSAITSDLRTRIIQGALPAGASLRVRDLARVFNVSVTPVLAALKRLEAEGYVVVGPRSGVQVTNLSATDLEELVVMRAALEGFGGRLAARFVDAQTLQLLQLKVIEARAILNSDASDLTQLFEIDRTFHSTLYGVAGRTSLMDKFAALRQRSLAYMFTASHRLQSHQERSWSEHERILEAVSQHDEELTANLVSRHVRSLYANVEPMLRSEQTR